MWFSKRFQCEGLLACTTGKLLQILRKSWLQGYCINLFIWSWFSDFKTASTVLISFLDLQGNLSCLIDEGYSRTFIIEHWLMQYIFRLIALDSINKLIAPPYALLTTNSTTRVKSWEIALIVFKQHSEWEVKKMWFPNE